jgi:hypothetical protein
MVYDNALSLGNSNRPQFITVVAFIKKQLQLLAAVNLNGHRAHKQPNSYSTTGGSFIQNSFLKNPKIATHS